MAKGSLNLENQLGEGLECFEEWRRNKGLERFYNS
jgi:hypothetical protein